MWKPVLQLVLSGLYLQVTTGNPSCTLRGSVAGCAFRGLYWVPALPPNITRLYLESNYISEINSTALRAYDQLEELDLGSQRVPLVIRNNAFLRQGKLIRLVLGDNIGLRLEPRAFAGLYKLQVFFLDHCGLSYSILEGNYLQPLRSLELLELSGNTITRLRPGLFFSTLTRLTSLNLKLNQIERLCEEDLAGFRGKYFTFLTLSSNSIGRMYEKNGTGCGNPFKDMTFQVLDLSSNGFNVTKTRLFFRAIQGTPIAHLTFSGHMGKGFLHDNLADPDESTFEDLANSTVDVFDLSNNFIFFLKKAVFSGLKVVRIIDVSHNKINQINRNAFDGLQGHLQMLNLSSNLLGEVHSYTFANLTKLRILDLSNNHIGALGYKAFSGLPHLGALFLRGNSLRDLGSPALLPNLQYLFLNDNKLKFLHGIADLGLSSIHLDLSDNRLTNLEDVYDIVNHFKHLRYFVYGGNFIKWCQPILDDAIPYNNSLLVLDLHDSSLQMIWEQGKCLDLFNSLNNLLGIILSFNSLTSLPRGIFRGLSSIEEMDLSSNALTFLEVDVFPLSLKSLVLSNNFLASPDPMTFQSLATLSLEGNHFHCDCHLESFLQWLDATNVTLSPAETHRCGFPAALRDLPLANYTAVVEPCEVDDDEAVQYLKFVLFIASALLVITVTLSGIVYARLRGQIFILYKKMAGRVLEGPKAAPPVEELQYDAFVCFSNNDYVWVEAALLKKLDDQFSEENIFHCCFEARDFLPGEDHLSNIRSAVWGSRKTLCIISKEFLKDGWCLEAFSVAQSRMLEELTDILILLVVGKVAHYQLMKYNAIRNLIQKREYLVWPEDPQDLDWFYERLITQLLKDSKTKKIEAEDKRPDIRPQDDVELKEIRL
ncbi:toll-like receptor 5 [Solea senegalensis]|uniref:Toll-like receptor 5 n=2 Tax=Solea senegalensis TaxID=28829 RepID=A0AAV6RU83_SOLSE|nr:toll-like receptor 5 [Solea senegalensis]KAG7509088.1 toll-like receptor 5 [Solea senegalensis]